MLRQVFVREEVVHHLVTIANYDILITFYCHSIWGISEWFILQPSLLAIFRNEGSTHGRTLLFLETIGPMEPLIWGEMCPKTEFSAFIQPVWVFLRKKIKDTTLWSMTHRKVYINFCHPTLHSLKNGHVSQNLFFSVILENIVFFEKLLNKK